MDVVERDLLDRDEMLHQLKINLCRAQQCMVKYANIHRKDVSFAMGDFVFVNLRPHRQYYVARRINQKLAARFYGPFCISQQVGTVAYHLDLLPQSHIHPVFHASQLKRAVGAQAAESDLPSKLKTELSTQCTLESILASRRILRGDDPVDQWLIH